MSLEHIFLAHLDSQNIGKLDIMKNTNEEVKIKPTQRKLSLAHPPIASHESLLRAMNSTIRRVA